MATKRTLWEEGRCSGRLVAVSAAAVVFLTTAPAVFGPQGVGLLFDVTFVAVCIAAALAVRPVDFFVVGVMPPLMMAVVVTVLAVVDRASVADPEDGVVQAVVAGLAHHATALMAGYVLALALLGVRRLALRRAGRLRRAAAPASASIPRQQRRSPQHGLVRPGR